jgi:hypothetical protein
LRQLFWNGGVCKRGRTGQRGVRHWLHTAIIRKDFVFVSEGASIGTDERPMGHGSGRPVFAGRIGTSYARTAGARRGCSGHGGGGGLSSVTHHRRPAPPPLDQANLAMVDWRPKTFSRGPWKRAAAADGDWHPSGGDRREARRNERLHSPLPHLRKIKPGLRFVYTTSSSSMPLVCTDY